MNASDRRWDLFKMFYLEFVLRPVQAGNLSTSEDVGTAVVRALEAAASVVRVFDQYEAQLGTKGNQ